MQGRVWPPCREPGSVSVEEMGRASATHRVKRGSVCGRHSVWMVEIWRNGSNRLGAGAHRYRVRALASINLNEFPQPVYTPRHQSLSPRAHRLVAPWSLQGAQMEEKSSRPFANGTFNLQGVQLDSCCGHFSTNAFESLNRRGLNLWLAYGSKFFI
jgi:hypothetical protein